MKRKIKKIFDVVQPYIMIYTSFESSQQALQVEHGQFENLENVQFNLSKIKFYFTNRQGNSQILLQMTTFQFIPTDEPQTDFIIRLYSNLDTPVVLIYHQPHIYFCVSLRLLASNGVSCGHL